MHWLVTENLNVEEDKGHWSIIAKCAVVINIDAPATIMRTSRIVENKT